MDMVQTTYEGQMFCLRYFIKYNFLNDFEKKIASIYNSFLFKN